DVSRRFPSLVALSLAALLAAAPASAQGPQRGLPGRNLLDRFGLERAWSNQATIDVRSDVVLHLVADEEVVIVQTRSGVLTVFDAQSGVKLWDGLLARPDQYSFPASTNAESLYVAIGSTVYARNKYTGAELWTLRLPGPPSTSPTVDADRMYVGTVDGSAYAFDLESVSTLQAEGGLPQFRGETTVWRYATSSEIVTAPVTNGKIVAFANKAGSLAAVTPEQRNIVFQFETNAAASAPLELVDDSLLYASGDTNLYCLRAATGTTRWLYVAGSPIREKPHAIGDAVFLVPVDAGMYNLGLESGVARWWAPTVTEFVAATPTRVFGSDRGGNLAVLDRADGALLGTIPVSGFPIRVRNERTDRIYLCSTSGLVTCLRERGAELPIYHRYPERRPILPLFGGESEEVEASDSPDATPEEREALEEAAEALPEGAK
ncbi:MAG TPA: PQQ-binding-like beta-propeller repeat protein, partial [Planctomycetaceae bacterium]